MFDIVLLDLVFLGGDVASLFVNLTPIFIFR